MKRVPTRNHISPPSTPFLRRTDEPRATWGVVIEQAQRPGPASSDLSRNYRASRTVADMRPLPLRTCARNASYVDSDSRSAYILA